MIKAAEENAMLDKTKKSLVNITYEVDNFLSKVDKLSDKNLLENKVSKKYFDEILKELKMFYKKNELTKINSKTLETLNNSYNLMIVEYFTSLLESNSSGQNNSKDNIVDIVD